MRTRNALLGVLVWLLSATIALAGSTVNPSVPGTSSQLTSAPIRNNFLATYTDINNILGVFAGATAPGNPTNLQSWADTSGSPNYVFRYWNGNTAAWVPYGTLNINTGVFSPYGSSTSFMRSAPVTVSVAGGVVTYGLAYDGNFAVTSNSLALASVGSGALLANCGASSAEPTTCAWTTFADRAIGATNGMIPSRVGGAWGTVSTGASGHAVPFLDGVNVFSAAQAIYPGTATLSAAQTGALLRSAQLDGVISRAELDSFGASSHFSGVRSGGTAAAKTALSSGDEITGLNAFGYNGTAYVGPSASVRMYAAQNWSVGANGTRVAVGVTASGGTTLTDALSVENDGGVTVPPTVAGGSRGAGSVNASSYYWAGTALSTAATATLGTSGATVPLLSTANTWGAAQTIPGVVVTGTFTATGLVTNADLVNTSTTVNGQTCVLGGTCTIVASAGSITVGTTTVSGGPGVLYNSSSGGALAAAAFANSAVLSTSSGGVPSFSTTLPSGLAMGTPASLVLTSATGLPISTGVSGLATGIASWLVAPTSANLATAVTDETGTGPLVFGTSPTMTTPTLGVATATSVNKVTITAPATSAVLTIPNGVTLTGPAASGTAVTLGNAETITGVKSFASGALSLSGATSGSINLKVAAVAGVNTITLPAGTTDFSATGGVGQYVKQATAGGALSVSVIAAADLPLVANASGGTASATAGAVKCDGTTITCTGGVITSSGSSASAITDGTTNVGSGVPGTVLYNNAGVLGHVKIPQIARATATFTTDNTSTTSTVYYYKATGGGAGGGGSSGSAAAGGGGGAGGSCVGTFSGIAPSTTVTISLGAAGGGGAVGVNGGVGGNSTVSATGLTTVTATGGAAGGGSTSNDAQGGVGGSCTSGPTGFTSIAGGSGTAANGNVNPPMIGGIGGASMWGGGGQPSQSYVGGTPPPATVFGSGGGGGIVGNVGASGMTGFAEITWNSIQ